MKESQVVEFFVASPGDCEAERKTILIVVQEFNQTWANFMSTTVVARLWERDAFPSAGRDAQDVINEQIGDSYDVFVGILKERFGTETPRGPSGTIEEYQRAIKRKKNNNTPDIMFYIHSDAQKKSERIREFMLQLNNDGVLRWSYSSDDFEKLFRVHMSKQVQRLAKSDSESPTKERQFVVRGEADLQAALDSVTGTMKTGTESLESYTAYALELNGAVSILTESIALATREIGRIGRPGFRQKPGARKRAFRNLESELNRFGDVVADRAPMLSGSLEKGFGSLSNALGILSPIHPLPEIILAELHSVRGTIGELQRSTSSLRNSITGTRDAIADWIPTEFRSFDDSVRFVLQSVDQLDVEMSNALYFVREVERSTEVFLLP